jgi:hypothetical protein
MGLDDGARVEVVIEASKRTGAVSTAANEMEDFSRSMRDTSESAGKMNASLSETEKAADALAGTFSHLISAAAIGAFFKEAIEESLKEEEALRSLRGAVEAGGDSWDKLKGKVEDYAAAQQLSTRFDDTVTYETLARLRLATTSLSQAMSATSLAMDLSVKTGRTLGDTTSIVNDLLLGQDRAVISATKAFGLYAGGATTAQGVLDSLRLTVGGAARAEDSHTKSLNQAKAAIADFAQSIGDKLTPVLAVGAKTMTIMAMTAELMVARLSGNKARVDELVDAILDGSKKVEETERLTAANSVQNEKTAAEAKKALQAELAQQYLTDTEGRFQAEREALELQVAEAQAAGITMLEFKSAGIEQEVALAEYRSQRLAQIAAAETQAVVTENKKQIDDKKKNELLQQKLEETRKQNFQSTMQFIATLSTSENKKLAVIGKAAALANAYINTSEAVTKALASAPPPINFALAAAVGVAGAAQIANIVGIQLKEGAVVKGTPGGTSATIGEENRTEAVLPLENRRSMGMIAKAISAEGGGGGGGTYILNATLVLPGVEALRDPEVARAAFELFLDNLERMPEGGRFSRRVVEVAARDEGRAS